MAKGQSDWVWGDNHDGNGLGSRHAFSAAAPSSILELALTLDSASGRQRISGV